MRLGGLCGELFWVLGCHARPLGQANLSRGGETIELDTIAFTFNKHDGKIDVLMYYEPHYFALGSFISFFASFFFLPSSLSLLSTRA